MRRTLITILAAAVPFLLAPSAWAQEPVTAKADLKNASGAVVGTATLTDTPHGVLIAVNLTDVAAGVHAFHIHAVGVCEPPFTSAGGHFNPAHTQHGLKNPMGMHAGDLPNIEVPASRQLRFERLASGVTLGAGPNTVFDQDGSALVLHEGADDYMSDPAGNAGARIACGVVAK